MKIKIVESAEFKAKLWPDAYGIKHKSIKSHEFGFYMPRFESVYLSNNLGYIHGFDPIPNTTECITEENETTNTTLHNFIQFVVMCKNRNVKAIDSLHIDDEFITCQSKLYDMIKNETSLFTGPTIYHAYYSQSVKMFNKLSDFREGSYSYNTNIPTRKRNKKTIKLKNYNYDPELAVHSIRLMNQAIGWCKFNTTNLQENNSLHMGILNGDINWEEFKNYYYELKDILEKECPRDIKVNSEIDYDSIRILLKNCLEEHYGTMGESKLTNQIVNDIDTILAGYRN